MKRPSFAPILALVSLLIAPALSAQEKIVPGAKHSLWKVQGKTNSVYLLGSIHFLKKEFYPLAAPIEDAYKKSSTVAFEADFDEMEKPETQFKFLAMGQYPDGETLEQNVDKETYQLLQKKLDGTLFQPVIGQFRPWMAAMTIAVLELQKLGFDPQSGLDRYFFQKAKGDGKKIIAFETVDFQMGLFTGLSKDDQKLFLKETLQEMDRFAKTFADIIDAWKTGDAKRLDTQVLEDMRKYPAIYKKLLLDRNQSWIPKIEELLAGGKDAFVCVGAAHMVGVEGVVELLRKKGYKIEQL